MRRGQLAQHVTALCREHDVTIRYRDRAGGYALKRQRTFVIRPVKTERSGGEPRNAHGDAAGGE